MDVDGQRGRGVLKIRQFSWRSYVHFPTLFLQKKFMVDVPLGSKYTAE